MFESGDSVRFGPDGTGAGPRQWVNAALECALATQPGPTQVALLAGIDPAELDDTGRVLLLRGLERQSRWLAGLAQRAMVAVAGPAPAEPEGDDWACNEVGAALGWRRARRRTGSRWRGRWPVRWPPPRPRWAAVS